MLLGATHKGEAVGCLGIRSAVYVSHLWVKREFRGGEIAEKLAEYASGLMTPDTLGLMVTTSPFVERLALRMGMSPVKGMVWRKDY